MTEMDEIIYLLHDASATLYKAEMDTYEMGHSALTWQIRRISGDLDRLLEDIGEKEFGDDLHEDM